MDSVWKMDPALGPNLALQIQPCGQYYGAILNQDLVIWIHHSDVDQAKDAFNKNITEYFFLT